MRQLALAIVLMSAASAASPGRPPNIVFILTDDLGIADLGAYGSDFHLTPRLDALAAEGMRFTAAYSASPVCSPTRAAILTGRYPHRLHLTDALPWDRLTENPPLIPPDHLKELPALHATYAKVLREVGYRTGLIGKWHLGNEHDFFARDRHRDYGFDEAFDADDREINEIDKGVETLTDQALAFIERNRDRPFLLALHHHTPHVPLVTPPEYESRFESVPPGQRHKNRKYAGLLAHLDEATGRLLDKLDELDLTGHTIVILTSDNGGLGAVTSNLPYRAGKSTLYEGGIRVPLVIRWPGHIEPGSVCDGTTVSTDFFPTFLEAAGLPLQPDAHLDGKSLVPRLRGQSPDRSRTVFWHLPHYRDGGPQSAVRDGRWKLVHNIEPDTRELFDLENDPGEAQNLATAQPERTAALAARLDEHLDKSGAQRMRPNPAWDPDSPRGAALDLGVFYPKRGGTFRIVRDRDYPAWFEHAEPALRP